MTNTTPQIWHAIAAGLTLPPLSAVPERGAFGTGHVIAVGDEIDPSLYVEASRNRYGESAFEDLTDANQVAQWGRVYFRKGTLESDRALVATLESEAAAEAARVAQEKRILRARYGDRKVVR